MSRYRSIVRGVAPVSLALIVALCGVLLTSQETAAHEHRQVGDYSFVVGFLNEPAVLEEPNGLDLRVSQGEGDDATPVEGLADTLQAEVIFGGESMELELEPAFGQPGSYQARFIPTAEGAYTFHITGTINGTQVDETFTSGPDTFSEVQSRVSQSFPNAVPAVGDVADEASDASSSASTALIAGIVGVVLGLIGVVLGAVALMTARRGRTAPATNE